MPSDTYEMLTKDNRHEMLTKHNISQKDVPGIVKLKSLGELDAVSAVGTGMAELDGRREESSVPERRTGRMRSSEQEEE